LVYDELRKRAVACGGETVSHEAWLRLVDVDYVQHWSSRRHFFGAAAEAIRRILIDRARYKNRQKHGADWSRITIQFEEVEIAGGDRFLEVLDEALQRFELVDATACELVKLPYFAGLSLRDAGKALELAPRTADRIWAYAKAWLLREVRNERADSS
jgi:RNA polymerase sigma factor (TIGR02999 family)